MFPSKFMSEYPSPGLTKTISRVPPPLGSDKSWEKELKRKAIEIIRVKGIFFIWMKY